MSREFSRKSSSLANVHGEFDAAAKHLSLSADQIALLREPRFTARMKFPVQMDNGRITIFTGYHTIHSIVRGPSIGGVQIRPHVELDTVEALASWSSHRCALLGIPFGGNSSAIECDPPQLSNAEMEQVSRRFMAELRHIAHHNNDILTADIGSNQQVMCWFMDTYSSNKGNFIPSVVLGKPVGLGGINIKTHPGAIGVDLCIRKVCEHIGLPLSGARAAIQGFGKVGMNVAKLLHASGVKVTAIADISGAYYNEGGINIDEAVWHQQSYGILDGLASEMDVKKMDDPMELFELPVDILVPAAIELQITAANVSKIKARVIAEAAQDPVSPEADSALYEKGVIVIPDILCNSGGVTGYYLEWVQNRTGYYWPEERMQSEIGLIVAKALGSSLEIAKKESIPLRLASAVLAVKRLNTAANIRGVYA